MQSFLIKAVAAKTDLVDAATAEQTAYGRLLIDAPRAECPEHTLYADEIAYWLETLALAEKSHAGRFTLGLENVS